VELLEAEHGTVVLGAFATELDGGRQVDPDPRQAARDLGQDGRLDERLGEVRRRRDPVVDVRDRALLGRVPPRPDMDVAIALRLEEAGCSVVVDEPTL
jgi:hypothetical protein